MKWQPRPSDIEWTRNLIDKMRDGGIWGIPMNGSVWKFDKTNKALICVHGKVDDMFHMLTTVCKHLGYTTRLALESLTPQQISESMMGTGKSVERPRLPETEL